MIIVCKSCKASFLVPATVFAAGPRTVRCAKCGNVWREVPTSKTHSAAPITPPPMASPPTIIPPSFVPQAPKPTPQPPPVAPERLTVKSLKKLLYVSLVIAFGILLFLSAAFVVGHNYVIQEWPQTQRLYIQLGLAEDPLAGQIMLQKITSERRYFDGAMHLVVQGEIFSQAQKRQVLPAIAAEATGPDNKIIERWRIAPPQVTIDPGMTVPFSSSILSPEGTVTEINLSFVEPPHDEP